MGIDFSGGENIRLSVVVPFRCVDCDIVKTVFVPVECIPAAHTKGKMLVCRIEGGAESAVPKCDCGHEMKAEGTGKLEVN